MEERTMLFGIRVSVVIERLLRGIFVVLFLGFYLFTSAVNYSSSYVSQIATNTFAGANTQEILRIKISATGGGQVVSICTMQFVMQNTDDAMVLNAHLYLTGVSETFTSPTLLATVTNPTGTITFNAASGIGTGTFYYWLVFDISPSAPDCYTFDAYMPTNSLGYKNGGGGSCPGNATTTPYTPNPGGYRSIETPDCWNYCLSTSSISTVIEHITGVASGTFSNLSGKSNYTDYTSLGAINTVAVGSSFNVTITMSGQSDPDVMYIYTDWNNDGEFIGIDENPSAVYDVPASSLPDYVFNLSVPNGASICTTTIRIKFGDVVNSFAPSPAMDSDPCQNSYGYGEVEDYFIEVIPSSRFWVGGMGDWNNSSKWSYTSGGASCSCVPTGSDIVVFDSNSIPAHHTEINVPSGTWQVKSIQFTDPALQPAIVGEGVLIINP